MSNRNKTLVLDDKEIKRLSLKLHQVNEEQNIEWFINKTINQDIMDVLDKIPDSSINLIIADPPYNLSKTFNKNKFNKKSSDKYSEWFASWFHKLLAKLDDNGSMYICCDWMCSSEIYYIIKDHLHIRNRISWQREKGRGAKSNWKNCSEDIWFGTKSKSYTFNVDDVKSKIKVVAPYKVDNKPKDWTKEKSGKFRLTYPSNFWTDITIPFWSMSENTEHPTQKPEKLIAKLILVSSNKNDIVFDPFLGSGTTSVVAKKLDRKFFGVELDTKFACICEKRLEMCDDNKNIQGYNDGVFWERNSIGNVKK